MKKKIFVTMIGLFMLAAMPMAFASFNDLDQTVKTDQNKDYTEIQVNEVPDAVMQAVQKDAPGEEVTKAQKIDKNGETIYKFTVGTSENEQTLKYKSDGTKYDHMKDETKHEKDLDKETY